MLEQQVGHPRVVAECCRWLAYWTKIQGHQLPQPQQHQLHIYYLASCVTAQSVLLTADAAARSCDFIFDAKNLNRLRAGEDAV